MSSYLHQFWYFAVKTSKHWGHGPRTWTAENLGFLQGIHETPHLGPLSPSLRFGPLSPSVQSPATFVGISATPGRETSIPRPTDLCNWAIHVAVVDYEPMESEQHHPREDVLQEWPAGWENPPFQQRLRDGIENNDFSNIKAEDMPITLQPIVQAVDRSPDVLLEEALGFAIIGRNTDLVADLCSKIDEKGLDVSGLRPLHLAIGYLDGSRTCCNIINHLGSLKLDYKGADDHGLTLFESLMVTILRSHTSIEPHELNETYKNNKSFVGEEVSICGRWDMDSDCIRMLHSQEHSAIPNHWKHSFCHTSVQAICHSISALSRIALTTWALPNGTLFTRTCFKCGETLRLGALHSFILTMYLLARSGMAGENLFGAIAGYLCLVSNRFDPTVAWPISISLLQGQDSVEDDCNHTPMFPDEFAERLTPHLMSTWTSDVEIGWNLFCLIVRCCRVPMTIDQTINDEMEYENDRKFRNCSFVCLARGGPKFEDTNLVTLWASIQAELLTYRRVHEDDPWISIRFNMAEALHTFQSEISFKGGFLKEGLVTEESYCKCGGMGKGEPPVADDVSLSSHMNFDIWNRSKYIPRW